MRVYFLSLSALHSRFSSRISLVRSLVRYLTFLPGSVSRRQVTYVVEGGHTGEVTSLSVCAVKPLFATACRSDCTVIVWNYQSRLPVSRKTLSSPPSR